MKALETSKQLVTLRALSVLLALVLVPLGGCSTDNKSSRSGSDQSADILTNGVPDASVAVDPCHADPAPGCPCDKEREGDLLACGKIKSRVDGHLTCGLGYSTCTDGKWGECAINNSITVEEHGSGGSKTLGLNGPVRCSDNPCAPGCVEFPDTPDGLDAGSCITITGSNMSIDPACPNGDFTRDYDVSSQCKPGQGVTWGLFSWTSTTPSDSKIEFFVQTADAAAALATAPKEPLQFAAPQGPSPLIGQPAVARATPAPSTQVGAVYVDSTLKALVWPRNKPFLRVTAHLVRGSDAVSVPTLKAWDLQALCRDCPLGVCDCPGVAGQVCGGACTDLWTDNSNCGACGTVCPSGQSCVAGKCSCPNVNEDLCGGVCTSLATIANCGSCGNACASTEVCNAGTCGCPSGQKQCSGKTPQTCNSGQWVNGADCQYVCKNGNCTGTCNPGDKVCDGNRNLKSCDNNGNWGTATCASVCRSGGCTGVCIPGALRCSGQTTQSCNNDGQWDNVGTCANSACVNGACQGVCEPAQLRCNGTAPQRCNASGAWVANGTCTHGCAVSNGGTFNYVSCSNIPNEIKAIVSATGSGSCATCECFKGTFKLTKKGSVWVSPPITGCPGFETQVNYLVYNSYGNLQTAKDNAGNPWAQHDFYSTTGTCTPFHVYGAPSHSGNSGAVCNESLGFMNWEVMPW